MDRSSGILLPVSALPGPCGIGDLGKAAWDFIDFLAAAGQRYWQILPLNPPDGAHSPYLSASTFAGSTDLLSPEPFAARGALTLDEGDELINVMRTDGSRNILMATHNGQAICFAETDVRPMGREAVGVRGIRLREGDYVVGTARAQAGKQVLSITENGFGKKTPVEEYRITNRGGLGIKNYMVTEKTGGIVGVKVVDGSEDLLLVTRAGILIRTPVEAIRTTGRATQGVIVMRFKEEGDSVISMALTEHEEDDEA